MSRIIAFTNQKGGVGKTTLCREIGVYLSTLGRRVLLIDLDMQGNLTKSFETYPIDEANAGSIYDALANFKFCFSGVEAVDNLHLLKSDVRLANFERYISAELDGYVKLQEMLAHDEFDNYNYILIDSPPSLGVLSVNALAAATHFIIPMNPAVYTMQGTNDLLNTVDKVRRNYNAPLKLLGAVLNAYYKVPVITREIRREIEESFGDTLFSSVLSRSIKVEEAIAVKRGIVQISGHDAQDIRAEVMAIGAEFEARLMAGAR
jgi:chromosome partitioning protein